MRRRSMGLLAHCGWSDSNRQFAVPRSVVAHDQPVGSRVGPIGGGDDRRHLCIWWDTRTVVDSVFVEAHGTLAAPLLDVQCGSGNGVRLDGRHFDVRNRRGRLHSGEFNSPASFVWSLFDWRRRGNRPRFCSARSACRERCRHAQRSASSTCVGAGSTAFVNSLTRVCSRQRLLRS